MNLKNFVDLVAVSTNLYMLSKDKELMSLLYTVGNQGKEKASEIWNDFAGNGQTFDEFMTKINERAAIAKVELEQKIEEIAAKTYSKLHLASTKDLELMKAEMESLKNQVKQSEVYIAQLQQQLQIKS